MSLFNVKQTENVEKSDDYVSGGGNTPLPSGIYHATLKRAWAKPSNAGALGVTLEFAIQVTGQTEPRMFTTTQYVTNRKGENFYTRNNKNHYLPGYNTVNELTLAILGKSFSELNEEDGSQKNIPIYNFKERKEIPEPVTVIASLWGKKVAIALLHQVENKTEKVGAEYVPTNEKREFNELDKILFLEGDSPFTYLELTNSLEEPAFAVEWLDKWKGKVKDKFKEQKTAAINNSNVASTPLTIG